MGYYTDFELNVDNDFIGEARQFLQDNSGYRWLGDYLPESKWYDWREDLKGASFNFPTARFTLEGQGEESDDKWVAYALGGKVQVAKAKITFDKCELW